MSRRDKTPASIMNKVANTALVVKEISDKLVKEYCEDLDIVISDIKSCILTGIDDKLLENFIIDLATSLYFTG